MSCGQQKDAKFQQYLSNGERLYKTNCQNCHQSDGSGLGKLIPPLNNDFASKNTQLVSCSIKYGLEGPIDINGRVYQGKMPASPHLSSLEIAEIITYITNNWGQKNEMVSVEQVEQMLKQCENY